MATSAEGLNQLEELKRRTHPIRAIIALVLGVVGLLFAIGLSISFGAANISLGTVWTAVFHFSSDLTEHQIIREIRLPRVLGAALVGACFAVAGSIMQGMTRNPLADSGLLGLNAGAAFMLAVCFAFFPGMSYMYLIMWSFVGAGLGVVIVYGVGSLAKGGLTPMRLVLAGAAVSALLGALGEGIALYYRIGQDLAFWYAGGVSGTKWSHLQILTPWILVAMIGALILSRSITLLSLGEELAIGLGQRTVVIKVWGMIIVLILAGAAVSVVGAVGFVGLIVPHLARYIVGHDYRWIISCSLVYGALLVVLADFTARIINPPYETPIGALIAFIGVPFFLYLARKGGKEL
ncbi:FecCD family ABC transporter permease [Lysinibacillus piscis]|uniref:Ferrichrome ABC transporter permease n=1 Tax=Lysinibacillus piscis TaxID=2518931 RepID=A0ABQ5NHW8_9BACI|nr:iron ABC transporter permease [Lysinibacillus sp. KH24]GLC87943.1 ferrichrome ABC transporter permease [Lysinibacillus sp. KH24]